MTNTSHSGRLRLAIVTNILSPYRVPLFNHIAAQPDVDLRVFLRAETEPNRHWDCPTVVHFECEIGSTWRWSPTRGKTIYANPSPPVVPAKASALPKLIKDGTCGLSVLPGDSQSLAEALFYPNSGQV
jgi:hypothetical protein